jgi:hypothetical protein
MRLWRRVGVNALVGIGILLAGALPVSAQEFAATEQALGVSPDPLARSPRQSGMGRLTVLGDDPHNRITLWDFAGNPAGIAAAESSSTLDLRPGTSSASDISDDVYQPFPYEQQTLAGRGMRTAIEGWRRAGGVAYGILGNFNSIRMDDPYSSTMEVRTHVSDPMVMGALNGPMPYVKSGRMKYALTLTSGSERAQDLFLTYVTNGAGRYIDRDGTTLTPPNFFVPNDRHQSVLSGSATVDYNFGRWLEAAATGHLVNTEYSAFNSGGRYYAETREQLRGHRPFPLGQASLIGHVGEHFEWGWDGRIWDARSEQHWVFTISAGIGQTPLEGRGTLARREERGSDMRTRVRWTQGAFEVGGSLSTSYLQNDIAPPDASDPSSFNQFLYTLYRRPNADSLAIPDSVSSSRSEQRAWDAAGGVAWRLPGRRGLVGIEYHKSQNELVQNPGGLGPRQTSWDVRTGLEYRLVQVLTGRIGYIHTSLDADELTRNNETISNTGTLGFTVQPVGAMWSFDASYGLELRRADYGDPAAPHGSRQQIASQLSWTF